MEKIKIICTEEQKSACHSSAVCILQVFGMVCKNGIKGCGRIEADACYNKNIDWTITDEV